MKKSLPQESVHMMKSQKGTPAPKVMLTTMDGQIISLAETWRSGQNVLLVFLRHLG